MKTGYQYLELCTNYTFTGDSPISRSVDKTENFLITQLNNDNPVMFLNFLESPSLDAKDLLNDKAQAKTLNLSYEQSFNNHWMTITKFFQDNNSGHSFVASSTWEVRVSINTKLLQNNLQGENTSYYSNFYVMR